MAELSAFSASARPGNEGMGSDPSNILPALYSWYQSEWMRLNVSVSQFILSAGTRPEICEPSQPTCTSGCDQKSAYLSAASFCCEEFAISTAAVGVRMLAAG